MAFINHTTKEINCKIVYYGPGLSGKTTNLEYIYSKTHPQTKGKLVTLNTSTERTLFFDFLPLAVGPIRGFHVRFHVYTVPGQTYYDATRKMILRGVDGVVFVADSQLHKMEENLESFLNLNQNLLEQGYELKILPHVLQYNKRDLSNIVPVSELHKNLNKYKASECEAVAIQGIGVFETLKIISKSILLSLKDNKKIITTPATLSPGQPSY